MGEQGAGDYFFSFNQSNHIPPPPTFSAPTLGKDNTSSRLLWQHLDVESKESYLQQGRHFPQFCPCSISREVNTHKPPPLLPNVCPIVLMFAVSIFPIQYRSETVTGVHQHITQKLLTKKQKKTMQHKAAKARSQFRGLAGMCNGITNNI